MASTATATSTAMGARAPKRAERRRRWEGRVVVQGGEEGAQGEEARQEEQEGEEALALAEGGGWVVELVRARGHRAAPGAPPPGAQRLRREKRGQASQEAQDGIPRLARGGDGRLRVRRRRRRRLRPRGRPTAHSRPPRATQKPPEVRGVRQGVHQPGAARGAQSRQGAPQGDPSGGVRQTRRRSRECRPGARECRPGARRRRRTRGSAATRAWPAAAPGVQHCALCRKTFTSDAQLAEHNRGKWHLMRLSGELAPSRKPYGA